MPRHPGEDGRSHGAGAAAGDRRAPGHGHEHGHKHRHEHGHDHGRERGPGGAAGEARARGVRALKIALAITATFMVVEVVGGLLSNSLALLADAAHMLTDAAALLVSLLAFRFARTPATAVKSYGWLRLEVLAALFNGVTLLAIAGGIFWEAWHRFRDPPPVDVPIMLTVAVLGLLANLAAAFVLHGAERHHLNTRAAYLHVLGDLLGSVGAIAAASVIGLTGWLAADPLISIAVGVLILVSAVRVSRQALEVLLEAVPAHIDLDEVERSIAAADGVQSVHDLHVWTLSSGVHLLTVHVVVECEHEGHDVVERVTVLVRERYGIDHATIQAERENLCAVGGANGFCR